MEMINPEEYTISIRRGHFEGEDCFEARVQELPDVAEYADSYEEAYQLALDTIQTTADVFAEQGKRMPAPIMPTEDYSGRVTLRLPKSLHRALALKSEYEGVSLNHLLVSVLSAFRGFDAALEEDRDGWMDIVEPPKKVATPQKAEVIPLSKYQNEASGW
jgi:predicted HicB family RNase H-like nuclease